jgi:hypothetical protein
VSDSKLNATESPKLFATEKKSRGIIVLLLEQAKHRQQTCQSNAPPAESFVGGSGALLLSIARGSRRSSRQELGVIRKGVDGVNSFSHWPITTDPRHYRKLARFSILDL